MKILIIRSFPSYVDLSNNTYNVQELGLAKALVRKGVTTDILFWTDREEKTVRYPANKEKYITVYYRKGISILKNVVYSKCDELFKEYDILQANEYNQMQSWILAKKYPKKTIIYHGPYYSSFNKKYNLMCKIFDLIFLKSYIKQHTKFITKSDLATDFLLNKGISKDRVKSVFVGLDTEMLQEKNKKADFLNSNNHKLKLLYIGKLERRRNIIFIVELMKNLISKNIDVYLTIIGDGSKEYVTEVMTLINKYNLEKNITYIQKLEQKKLGGYYQLSDIFLLPTEYEIFGMVLLEAMYFETVAITTENGGSQTLIDNEKNGYILNELDLTKWADKIERLYYNRDLLTRMKIEANNKIENEFEWDYLAKNFIEEYKTI